MSSDRREFLRAIIGGAAGLSISTLAFGQAAPTPITATKLTDHLVLLAGDGGNVVVVISPDGLMMIDGGLPERSARNFFSLWRNSTRIPSARSSTLIGTSITPAAIRR